jgi:hypothetical protein
MTPTKPAEIPADGVRLAYDGSEARWALWAGLAKVSHKLTAT